MSGTNPVNTFSLLQMEMNGIQKAKKSSGSQNSNSSKPKDTARKKEDKKEKLPKERELIEIEIINDPDIPDRSFGDYFCPLCDSHMNSDGMWEAHILGKRHLKNVKKGEQDSKYDDLDVESNIKHEVRNVKDPVIGLSYVHEIRRKDAGAPPLYTCYLCQATFPTVPLVIEHVLSLKHRMNYMKENSKEDYTLLEATNLKKGHLEPLVEETALRLEESHGRGEVKVKQERSKQPAYTYSKKNAPDSEEEDKPSKKSHSSEVKNLYTWKAADYPKKDSFKESDKYSRDSSKDHRSGHYTNENLDSYKRDSYARKLDSYSDKYNHPSTSRDSFHKDHLSYSKHPASPVRYSRSRSPRREDHHSRSAYGAERSSYSHSRSPSRENSHRSRSTRFSPVPTSYSQSRLPLSGDNYRSKSTYDLEPLSTYSQSRSTYGPEPPPSYSQSRSFEAQEKSSRSSDGYIRPDSKDSDNVLQDFVMKISALPAGIFLKIVLYKLDSIEVKGIDELNLLSKVINKAQVVLCNKLPPDVQAVLKEKMAQSSENNAKPAESFNTASNYKPSLPSQLQNDYSILTALFDQRKNLSQPSVNPNASYQGSPASLSAGLTNSPNPQIRMGAPITAGSNQGLPNRMSFQSPSYGNRNPCSQNNFPFSTPTPSSSSIPGLTLSDENKDRQFNSFQTYPNQSPNFSVPNQAPNFRSPNQPTNYPSSSQPSNYPPYQY